MLKDKSLVKSLKSLTKASRELARRPRGRKHEQALLVLAASFFDVEVPADPIELMTAECAQHTEAAAREMHREFKAALKDARRGRMTARRWAALAQRVDPLWREMAAANWDVVSEVEAERFETAKEAVEELVEAIGFSARMHGAPPEAVVPVLRQMLADLDHPGSPIARSIVAPLKSHGVGAHHARAALEDLIADLAFDED